MPFSAPLPPLVQVVGRSEPILIVPLVVPPPLVPPPQAKATSVAAVRTISPLARTIWFPLVLVGRAMRKPHQTPPITCRPLPNSSRGESAPAASAATWDGRTTTPSTLSTCRAPQVKSKLRRASAAGRHQ